MIRALGSKTSKLLYRTSKQINHEAKWKIFGDIYIYTCISAGCASVYDVPQGAGA